MARCRRFWLDDEPLAGVRRRLLVADVVELDEPGAVDGVGERLAVGEGEHWIGGAVKQEGGKTF